MCHSTFKSNKYDIDAKQYKYVIDKSGRVIRVEPDCTFEQLVSSIYTKFNVSPAEKSVEIKYKFKKLDMFALPMEIHDDIDFECFLVECSCVDSRSSMC